MVKWWKSIEKPPNLKKIIYVDISYKKLTAIPDWISNCNNLKRLLCYKNEITQIPNNLPENLEELNCDSNLITQIPTTLPNSLKYLSCCYNLITHIPDILPNHLQLFYCWNNQITHIPNALPRFLKSFCCETDHITYIPDDLPDSLEYFRCVSFQIKMIPLSIIQLQKLEYFFCIPDFIVYMYKAPLVKYFLDNLDNKEIKKYCYDTIWKVRMEY